MFYWFPPLDESNFADSPLDWTADILTLENKPTEPVTLQRLRLREGGEVLRVRFTKHLKKVLEIPSASRQVTIGIKLAKNKLGHTATVAGLDARLQSHRPRMVLEVDQSRLELEFDRFSRKIFTLNTNMYDRIRAELYSSDSVDSTSNLVLWYNVFGVACLAAVPLAQIAYTRSLFNERYS